MWRPTRGRRSGQRLSLHPCLEAPLGALGSQLAGPARPCHCPPSGERRSQLGVGVQLTEVLTAFLGHEASHGAIALVTLC